MTSHRLLLVSLALLLAGLPVFTAAADRPARQTAPALRSLPAPAAAGPLRILLVDDDFSDNNHNPGDSRQSPSDRVFRQIVAGAVGGDAKAWSIEHVKPYASGPGIERLRPFSLIVWYTGAIYGGNPDNTGVLSIEDEKTVRRYLEEVGGAVILFSPGYLSKVLGASGTWEKSDWKFLTEVLGLRGGHGLAQRFLPGTVTAPDGARFNVDKGGAGVESQFSLANPAGAAVLFSTVPAGAKPGSAAAPVATSHAYGKGRFIYVGFTFENLAAAEHAPAFGKLLAATGLQRTASPAMSVSRPQAQEKRQAAGSDPGFSVQVSGTHFYTTVSWTLQTGPAVNAPILGPEQTARKAPAGKAPAAPAPAPTVTVQRWKQFPTGAYGWAPMTVHPGYSQVVDVHDYPQPERRYRVTVTEASGATSFKEVQANLPIRDPESLTATVQSDRSIILSWPEVPGVTKYRVLGTLPSGRGRVGPEIVNRATEWRSPPLGGGKRIWELTSLFERQDGEFVVLTDQRKVPWTETEVPYVPSEYFLTTGTVTIHTGNDNKEAPSSFGVTLYVNGGETTPEDSANPNPHRLQYVATFETKAGELKVNSSAGFKLTSKAFRNPDLATVQQYGLRIRIKYLPNFPLDAWKIDRAALTVNFQAGQQMESKTMTFSNVAKLLTAGDNQIDLIADGSFRPIP
jgi:hypothetical protein